MSDIHSERKKKMSSVCEASSLIKQIAEPRPVGDTVKAAIGRSLRRLPLKGSWTWNRVKDIWYADHRVSVSADEMNDLRKAARIETQKAARDEYQWLVARIEKLEAIIAGRNSGTGGAGVDEIR